MDVPFSGLGIVMGQDGLYVLVAGIVIIKPGGNTPSHCMEAHHWHTSVLTVPSHKVGVVPIAASVMLCILVRRVQVDKY